MRKHPSLLVKVSLGTYMQTLTPAKWLCPPSEDCELAFIEASCGYGWRRAHNADSTAAEKLDTKNAGAIPVGPPNYRRHSLQVSTILR